VGGGAFCTKMVVKPPMPPPLSAVTFQAFTLRAYTFQAPPSSPPTTEPSVVTIIGGPNATANIPGAHNDPADLYGIGLGIAAIVVAIVLTRWLFGRGRSGSKTG